MELGLHLLLYKRYSGLEEERDIRYMPGGKRTFLDIIRPADSGVCKRPLLIYTHGGGWVSGLRGARRYYCRSWAERGFVCANIGYDYALDAKHPEHIRQIFTGIEYVLKNAGRYGIDPSEIVVAGESAGGYFASLISAVSTHRELYEKLGISFAFQESFAVSACILISGIFDPARAVDTNFPDMDVFIQAFCGFSSEELKRENQRLRPLMVPSYYADACFPPAFIIGSDKDRLLPESIALHQELDRAGVRNDLFICRGLHGVHAGGLACHIGPGRIAAERSADFVNGILSGK